MKNNVALAHNCHAGKSCSKFGLILPRGLGDSVTNGWTDGRRDEQAEAFIISSPHLF